jgi:hypothetical protein
MHRARQLGASDVEHDAGFLRSTLHLDPGSAERGFDLARLADIGRELQFDFALTPRQGEHGCNRQQANA